MTAAQQLPPSAQPTTACCSVQERWIQGLLAFHFLLLLLVLLFRRIPGVHGAIFLGMSEQGATASNPSCRNATAASGIGGSPAAS
jgi:hypothetical protein